MRTTALITFGVAIALLLLFGCPKEQPPAPQRPAPPPRLLTGLPVEMTVEQRTTTPAPGSEGAVQITVDDITRGQVMASVAAKSGKSLLAPTSLSEGKSASFELDGQTYYLTVRDLDNELVGDDSAVLMLDDKPPEQPAEPPAATGPADEPSAAESSAADAPSTAVEAARIRKLIDRVRSQQGAVFIRNGEEHTPAEAADHLQRKWEAAGDEIRTAEDFIDQIASKSSTSGEPYLIRLPDGKEAESGDYLRQQLKSLE